MARKIKLDLATWRTARPQDIHARLQDYVAILATLTAGVVLGDDEKQYLLANAVGKAGSRACSTAMVLAERLDTNDANRDLAFSWLAVAALVHHAYDFGPSAARLTIAMRLLQLANIRSTGFDSCDDHGGEAKRLQLLAFAWADQGVVNSEPGRYSIREIFGRMGKVGAVVEQNMNEALSGATSGDKNDKKAGRSDEDIIDKAFSKGKQLVMAEAAKAEAELAALAKVADGPNLIVCRAIGATGKSSKPGELSGDDKAIANAWRCLTEPMALACGPAPETLSIILTAEFPWMVDAIDAICGDLTLRQQVGLNWAKFRPTLLVGAPGSGKTRFARRLSELLKIGFGEVNAAGSSDNRMLQGTARGWSTASPCYPLCVMRQHQVANPLILVDEIDKPKPDGRNGDIRATLLTMLEPLSAKSWADECLVAPVDLSAVNWLCCANDVTALRGPLLTRLKVIDVPVPSERHFHAVLGGMRRDLAGELGVALGDLPELPPQAETLLRNGFRRGISLRRVRAAVEGALLAGGGFDNAVRH